jgi:hypothetical protein
MFKFEDDITSSKFSVDTLHHNKKSLYIAFVSNQNDIFAKCEYLLHVWERSIKQSATTLLRCLKSDQRYQ